jgi:hypothetical protein
MIELGLIASGVPDMNYCVGGVEGWIELKATEGVALTIRPGQVSWIERRVRAGGRVHVAVRRRRPGGPRRGEAIDELWLYHGSNVRLLEAKGLAIPPLGRWGGGPSRWDWAEVRRVLTS